MKSTCARRAQELSLHRRRRRPDHVEDVLRRARRTAEGRFRRSGGLSRRQSARRAEPRHHERRPDASSAGHAVDVGRVQRDALRRSIRVLAAARLRVDVVRDDASPSIRSRSSRAPPRSAIRKFRPDSPDVPELLRRARWRWIWRTRMLGMTRFAVRAVRDIQYLVRRRPAVLRADRLRRLGRAADLRTVRRRVPIRRAAARLPRPRRRPGRSGESHRRRPLASASASAITWARNCASGSTWTRCAAIRKSRRVRTKA